MNSKKGKVWRIAGIVFMGMTAAMNILGGSGTVCAAFLTRDFPPLWAIITSDMQWLYQSLMITTIITGLVGVWATTSLIRGGDKVYRNTLITLVVGTILGGTQYVSSLIILGKAVPANIKFFTNLATLILFLVFLLPALRDQIDFSKPGGKSEKMGAGGLTAFIAGIIILTVFIWAGPSHEFMGDNWVEWYSTPILIVGITSLLGGLFGIVSFFREELRLEKQVLVNT